MTAKSTAAAAAVTMPSERVNDSEIDERLWPGAAAQGWDVQPRGELEAARKHSSWIYVEPDGTKHKRRADALEAFRADVDRRLWPGAAEQGWSVLARGARSGGKWWYVNAQGERFNNRASAHESIGGPSSSGCGVATQKRPNGGPNAGNKRPRHEQEDEPGSEEDPRPWLKPAALVEVQMHEEGLRGSRYTAHVLRVKQSHALVEFEAFASEHAQDEQLQEWVAVEQLLPRPPPPPPEWWTGVHEGDTLELFHEDGWWEVVLRFKKPAEDAGAPTAMEFQVASHEYKTEEWVDATRLRPLWMLAGTHVQHVWRADSPAGLVVYGGCGRRRAL